MLMTRRWEEGLETAMLDVRSLKSPWPLHWTRWRMKALPPGRPLKIVSTDPRSSLDIQELIRTARDFELVEQEEGSDDRGRRTFTLILRRKS